MKVLSIIGTRPEAIKMVPVIQELQRHPAHIVSKVCVTAQHRQMLDQVLELFNIEPDYDLDIMKREQSLTSITVRILADLQPILEAEQPDWVLIQGDTTSVMAASLAASYQQIKIGHIEAGLRTYDPSNPFPEEVNRRIADVLADRLFAPTSQAVDNLRHEGFAEDKIILTGNTVVDALHQMAQQSFLPQSTQLAGLPTDQKRLILVTSHRREHQASAIEDICLAVRAIAERYDDVHFVFPVHPSPRIRSHVYKILSSRSNISLLTHLDYLSFIWLLKNSYLVMTDSGGLQEEAPCLCKPLLILRDTTERPEGLMTGCARLVGTEPSTIFDEASRLLTDHEAYQAMAQGINPYGDGQAARRIVHNLISEQSGQAPQLITAQGGSNDATYRAQ